MSGYCQDCGNTQCICAEVERELSLSQSELAAPAGSEEWQRVTETLPPMDTPCWLWDGKRIWIGGRGMVDSESWLWGNAYGSIWHNGVKWEADNETDDDYQPTHWMSLPTPPNRQDQPHGWSEGLKMMATNKEMESMKAQSEAQRKAVLAASGGYAALVASWRACAKSLAENYPRLRACAPDAADRAMARAEIYAQCAERLEQEMRHTAPHEPRGANH